MVSFWYTKLKPNILSMAKYQYLGKDFKSRWRYYMSLQNEIDWLVLSLNPQDRVRHKYLTQQSFTLGPKTATTSSLFESPAFNGIQPLGQKFHVLNTSLLSSHLMKSLFSKANFNLPNNKSLSSRLASRLSLRSCRSISALIRFCSFCSSDRQHAILNKKMGLTL